MTNGEVAPTAEHRTVARVMAILELVLASGPHGMRLADLSAAIDAPKSTVHGLARGLVATGYFREERGRYFTGAAISSLIAVGPTTLPSVFHHALEELTAKWNETSMVATLVGDSLVYLDSVEPVTLIRAAPQLNKRLSIWPRSSGKCLLAFMEPKRLEAYLRRNHPAPADAERVRGELARIRETHVGMNIGETIADHIGLASPIIVGNAPVTIAIAVVGPKSRMQDHVHEIAHSIRETAESLSRT
ncbi:MAG TPA: IclR family transcriptional regulator [Galbitalea sp.]|nr:IclR family transcriptional regulator [Galbitalea sp.]